MDNAATGRPASASRELMRLMGRVIANGEMYGPEHRLTTDAIDACYEFVRPILDVCERVSFSMADGMLLVEDEPAGTKDSFVNTLSDRLAALEVSGLSLVKGLSREEFGKLITIMFSGVRVVNEEGEGMQQALAECGVEHVHTRKVTHCTITQQEEIVLKSGDRAAGRRGEGAEEQAEGDGGIGAQITAFLKGDVTIDAEDVAKNLAATLLSNPERLARFIMERVAVQPGEAGPSGEVESLADIVVVRLDRIRRVLLKECMAKSAKRKMDLKKNLLLLGKEILNGMRGAAAPVAPEAETAISAAIDDMVGELDIKAIAAEYAKKRASFVKAERDLIKRIEAMGAERAISSGLGEDLSASGATAGDWRTLLVKAGGGAVPPGDGREVGEIVVLLAKLDEMIRAGRPDADAIIGIMSQATAQIETLAGETERQIVDFGAQIQQLDETLANLKKPQRVKAMLSRTVLIEMLANIIEQLFQPVTVLYTAIQMTVAGYLGPVSAQQKEALEMAMKSGERATDLLHKLMAIVGVPDGGRAPRPGSRTTPSEAVLSTP